MYMYICMHIDTYIYTRIYIYISCDTMGCNGDVIGSTICIYVYSCIYIYIYIQCQQYERDLSKNG